MHNKDLGAVLFGALTGGFLGYMIGVVISDALWPEESWHEEELTWNPATEDHPTEDSQAKLTAVAYHNFYTKPALDDLVTMRQGEEPMFDEEEEFDEEDSMELDSPMTESEFIEYRDSGVPHIITLNEWNENEYERKHGDLKYYAEDGVLTDINSRPVINMEKVVGDVLYAEPLPFGMFADDDDLLYVANPDLNAEYRIRYFAGSYEELVLGALPRQEIRVRKNIFDGDDRDELTGDLPEG